MFTGDALACIEVPLRIGGWGKRWERGLVWSKAHGRTDSVGVGFVGGKDFADDVMSGVKGGTSAYLNNTSSILVF